MNHLEIIAYRICLKLKEKVYMLKDNKRGMESSFMWLIIAVGFAILVTFGFGPILFKAVFFTSKCEIRESVFLGDLFDKVSLLTDPNMYDTVRTSSFTVPCGDRAYLVNVAKMKTELELMKADTNYKSPAYQSLDEQPLIKESIQSGLEKNFFIVKDNKIVASYSIGNVNVDYPYNICFDTKKSGMINVELRSRGKYVRVIPNCEEVECAVVPEKLEQPEIETLLNDICKGETGTALDECKNAERQNIENAKGNIDVKLKVSTCFPETTKVEFIIKPTRDGIAAKEVKLIETIDKNCVNNDLKAYLKKLEGGTAEIIMRPNPMIVWAFPTLSEEQKVAYHLSKYLDDNCRKQLRAVAGAELIVKESAKDTPTSSITNAELAPVTGSEQKHIMSVTQRKPHPPRFESRNPANPTQMNPNLPADFIVIPEDKKGKLIFIVPEPTAPRGITILDEPERKGREEPPIVVSNMPPTLLSITAGERDILRQ